MLPLKVLGFQTGVVRNTNNDHNDEDNILVTIIVVIMSPSSC